MSIAPRIALIALNTVASLLISGCSHSERANHAVAAVPPATTATSAAKPSTSIAQDNFESAPSAGSAAESTTGAAAKPAQLAQDNFEAAAADSAANAFPRPAIVCQLDPNPPDELPEIKALPAALRTQYLVPDCSLSGCVDSPAKARSNVRKNWVKHPTPAQIDHSVTLEALMAPSADDRQRWKPDSAVTVEGWVRSVKVGGFESVNCRTENNALKDTHFDLAMTRGLPEESPDIVVAEVTPRIRALAAAAGKHWSTDDLKALEGKRVRFTGWLFFDNDHCSESANSSAQAGPDCGGHGSRIWRRTGWEIHPITSFEVIP